MLISVEEARRASDLGDLIVIWPEFQFHARAAARPGRELPEGFVYSSHDAEPRLSLEQTRTLLDRVA